MVNPAKPRRTSEQKRVKAERRLRLLRKSNMEEQYEENYFDFGFFLLCGSSHANTDCRFLLDTARDVNKS
jgi:hypothetical protein